MGEQENKPMVIKEGWFCYGANFDVDEPYVIVVNKENNEEVKIPVPEQLAYYLRTHFCGSKIMRTTIREHAISDLQYKMKECLGIK